MSTKAGEKKIFSSEVIYYWQGMGNDQVAFWPSSVLLGAASKTKGLTKLLLAD